MAKYTILYHRQIVQEYSEEIDVGSLAEAYAHAKEVIARQEEDPTALDVCPWVTNMDLTDQAYCDSITCDGVVHVFHEIPEDLDVKPADAIDTLTVVQEDDGNTWEGVVDGMEELGQRDKDLFGPVL